MLADFDQQHFCLGVGVFHPLDPSQAELPEIAPYTSAIDWIGHLQCHAVGIARLVKIEHASLESDTEHLAQRFQSYEI